MDVVSKRKSSTLANSVKFVFALLLANAVPAFIILITLPGHTDILFVWTIKPVINAQLIGVMYSNALFLIAVGLFQTSWARVRIVMVVITLFSILATILTFFYLDPFLAHPWYHLTYWLSMYLILFFAAPAVFVVQEIRNGGRLPVQIPLNCAARLLAGIGLVVSLVCGLGLLFRVDIVDRFWPWALTPLVGGLIGVLLVTHAAAYAWAQLDGDWLRVRPIFWQAPVTGALLILLPLIQGGDLRADAGLSLALYYLVAGYFFVAHMSVILTYRAAEKSARRHDQ